MVRIALCVSLFLFVPILAYAQWARTIHVDQMSTVDSIEQTFDGGFAAAGTSVVNYVNHALFIRLDSGGKLQWANTYGPAEAYQTLQTSDGGFVIAGSAVGDALVVKLDAGGNILWQRAYGASSTDDAARAIVQAPDGGFFLLGKSVRQRSGQMTRADAWCLKLRSDGTVLWQKAYGYSEFDKSATILTSVTNAVATNDGGVIFVGNIVRVGVGWFVRETPWVVKLNENGNIVWQRSFFPGGTAAGIAATADGGYIVGTTWGYALKLAANGAAKWTTAFRYKQKNTLTAVLAVRQEKDGHILVMGTVGKAPEYSVPGYFPSGDIWTARLDSNGKMFWQAAFGETDATINSLSIHESRDDGTVFTGTIGANSPMDGFIAQTASSGMVCSAFRKSLRISSETSAGGAGAVDVKRKQNAFAMTTAHLTRAPASVQFSNLCTGK